MNKKNKIIIILFLITSLLGIGLYIYGAHIQVINKFPYISKKHDHFYKPVFNEQGKIDYWTCAMHPSVRLEEQDRCPICGMDTTPVWKKEHKKTNETQLQKKVNSESNEDQTGIQGHDHSSHGLGLPSSKRGNMGDRSTFTVTPERQQLIGVKTQPAMVREINKVIRTVGIVELDETRIEHIHTKISGWIEDVFVDFIGQSVRRGEPVFSIYSPELVSTQEEYLLALKSKNILDKSEFKEINEAGNSLLKASKRRLELWDISTNQIKKLEETGEVKKNLIIYSPISGIVMEKHVFENKHVSPDETLYVIADHSKVWIQVDIYENEIQLINLGDKAKMTLTSFPGEEFPGEVAFISPHIDPKTRTVKVRLEFPNPDLKLLPEMYTNVVFTKRMDEKLTIPTSSVLRTGKQDIVFINKGDGVMQIRKVLLGIKAEGFYEVIKGLKEGEEVVASANFLIDSESKVQAAVATWEDLSEETNKDVKENMEMNLNETEPIIDIFQENLSNDNMDTEHKHNH